MKIVKGDKTVEVPNVLVFVGIIALDNVICNICKASSYKKLLSTKKDEES